MAFLPYPPQSIDDSIALLRQDVNIAHDIIHGDENTEVDTENGLVPSFAKAIANYGNSANLKLITTSDTTITIDETSGSKHYLCTANSLITVNVSPAATVESTDIGITVFFTQLGEGTIQLVPAVGVQLIHPQDSTPTTYDSGSTIACLAVTNFKWVVTGNLGY